MAVQSRTLRLRRIVDAPIAEAYRAFTNSVALREWFCDAAQTVPVKGGRFYVAWNDGEYASGTYTALVPNKTVAFSWLGKGHPAETQVRVSLSADGNRTNLLVTHSGFGKGSKWNTIVADYTRAWESALENLQSMLESGPDLRLVRRPLLGLSYAQDLTPEERERLRLPVSAGCRIESVAEGRAAQTAGLQHDDVIVRLGGSPVRGFSNLLEALQRHRAGDQVTAVFYRDGEKQSTLITLSGREIPEIPASPHDLAREVSKLYLELDSEMERALAGADDVVASYRPSPQDWGIKQIIAHLIDNERGLQYWLTCMVQAAEAGGYTENLDIRLEAIICAHPALRDLMREYKKSRAETVAFVDLFPESFTQHKGTYWEVGYAVLDTASHTYEHINRMTALVQAARNEREASDQLAASEP